MRYRAAIRCAPALAGLVAAACGDSATETVEPTRYESEHFVVLDFVGIHPGLADSLTRRLEADYTSVSAFLPDLTPPPTIQANIFGGWNLPSTTLGEAELTQWSENLVFDYNVHLLIHIFTGYENGQFLEEGLAVYGTEELVPESRTVEPYRGQVPHAWVSLYSINGTAIPFESLYNVSNVSYDPSGSVVDASAWQFFIHAGSFTRWVFDEYGEDAWWRLYRNQQPQTVLGLDAAGINDAWVATTRALYPTPLPCQVALRQITFREGFWCAITEGR